ncbi:DUF3710 domain-containing protein [Bifidobacterium choloepi]|uniref:DUF3710 domain-containing protein n=1 Tax=Bifidobacterium choloepi TaxID=2614131 RepID=A0A6I5NIB1_9BIFI|nr:DUF3710 domain-containing protein [Bifidobacterium choloepi]NEG70103.1 DUF3710 domain-containing protein [Bifidobacterium choloepi]
MGLFGFGRKKKQADETEADEIAEETADKAAGEADDVDDEAVAAGEEAGDDSSVIDESGDEADDDVELTMDYEGRGEIAGPWDVDDENVPDYDEYLSLGSYYLPFVKGMSLRVKASRATREILGTTMTLGKSSVEVEAFAAPKTMGLWDDVRADLLEANPAAKEVAGVFGAEVLLPVKVKSGNVVMTRIVGVDGPRWMLRGIFSGTAAADPDSEEAATLNDFFADIVVERGEEPLAPRDLIPMHAPLTPSQRRDAAEAEVDGEQEDGDAASKLKRPDGPLSSDHETETKTTLSRGPMFSEVR